MTPPPLRWWPQRVGYVHGPRVMSWLRQRWVLLRHPHAMVRFGRNVYLGPGFSVDIPAEGTFVVGDDVEFRRNFRAEISGNGRISIGSGSHFTYSVVLQCSTNMDIGERVVMAQNVIVVDGQHRFRDIDRPMLEQGYDLHEVTIGDDASIMSKCTVMADIGRRAYVGANSVVSRPIPAFTVAVGTPARPISYFGPAGDAPAELAGSPAAAAE